MNKCYFGNFQDFCKYGLLRRLAAFARRRKFNLHFCQMITEPRAPREQDYAYLQNDNLARLDESLFNHLKKWREKPAADNDNQWARESQKILPEPDVRHDNRRIPVVDDFRRSQYFQKAIAEVKRRDVIFFNPDYGLAFADRMLRENAPRYLKADEIKLCIERGISVLFYQETLFPKAKDAAGRLYRDVWRCLYDAGIRCRLYCFESRAPSFTKQQKTATAGFFWVAPVGKIHAGRAEKFAEEFDRSPWCHNINHPAIKPMFQFERRVGFFVDADNVGAVQIRKAAEEIMSHIPFGRIVAGSMFGRDSAIGRGHKALCKKWGLDDCGEVEGDIKNQADMGVSFDIARKIFDRGIDTAVVFSGDGAFVATAREVKKLHIAYWGAGNPNTKKEYSAECDKFFDVVKIKMHGVTVTERKKHKQPPA